MSDAEILKNLSDLHGWRNIDMGAGGNCLFLSVAPQVTAADVAALPSRSPVWKDALGADVGQRWEGLQARERARLLRRIAILDESEFVADLSGLCARAEAVPEPVRERALELFKDMAEEFIDSNLTELAEEVPRWPPWNRDPVYKRVRDIVQKYSTAQVHEFVLVHAAKYMQITGRDGNWAGSSEMAALANALGRSFAAYGNNWVSQDSVELLRGEVQPYFNAPAPDREESGSPPVLIFQTNGGGHYQMLTM